MSAISRFNTLVSTSDVITLEATLSSPPSQHALSRKLDSHLFHSIMMTSSPANKARLLSSSAAHASSWLSVVPSVGLGLQLDSSEFHTAVNWWLGMNSTARASCPFCPDTALDPLGIMRFRADMGVMQGRRRRTKSGPVVFPSNGGRAGGAAPGRVREGGTPPAQPGGVGERCKLPHRGLGRSPRSQRFLRCKTLQNYARSAIKI